MATRKKKESGAGKPAATKQLSFDFDILVPQPVAVPVKPSIETVAEIEILPREPVLVVSTSPPRSEGAAEHEFLRHQADKYEERALRAVWAFVIASCLTVLVKGGIPVSQAALEKLGLPAVSNARLLAGMLGAATVVFAIVMGYYTLRVRQHSPQLRLPLVNRSLAGRFARLMLIVGVLLLAAMFVAALYLTWRDILYLVTTCWTATGTPWTGGSPLALSSVHVQSHDLRFC
jgi:hypothetical protein